MTTTPTQLPVPSEKPQDLKFNAGKIDEFVTSLALQYIDRFGGKHYTIEGLKQLVLQQIYNLGWNPVGTFQGGAIVANPGDIVQDTSTGAWYRWDNLATLPKTVPVGSTPGSAGGTGEGKWQLVDVSDVLRKDLASSSAGKGASLVVLESGDTVEEAMEANSSASYRDRCITKLAQVDYAIRSKGSIKVLFQGDSMTAGYDVTSTDTVAAPPTDNARHATTTYPSRFAAYLPEQSGISMASTIRAISGYTAKQAFEEPAWQANPNCDIALLMYGLNDAGGSAGANHDNYIENMEKLIRRFIDWGMAVVVMTCASGGYGSTDRVAQSYARQIKNMATVYGCAYFNANEVQYNRGFGEVQSDGIHFNSNGYARLGEAIASMFMAGGLMPNYRPISSEIIFWPGIESDQVGYLDAKGNVNLARNTGALSLQKITGITPIGSLAIMSFSFYLDAEAAEVDILGMWTAGSNLSFIMQQSTVSSAGVNVPYYSPVTNSSNLSNKTTSFTGKSALINLSNSSGGYKHLGLLSGRGWKTITIFGNATENAYIQGVNVRPIPSYLLSRSSAGSLRRGVKEVSMLSIPNRDYKPTAGIPTGFSLGSVVMPLPFDLHPIIWDNDATYFDAGFAKLVISGMQDGAGLVYFEGLISKTASGTGFTVTVLKTIGTWPTITATCGTKQKVAINNQGSVAPNMPYETIYGMGDDGTFSPGTASNEYGLFLKILLGWVGSPPTGYYNVSLESFSRGLGGAASLATL